MAAQFLISVHAGSIAEKALSHELLLNNHQSASIPSTLPSALLPAASNPSTSLVGNTTPYLLLSQLEIQRGNFSLASEYIREALSVRQDDPEAWSCVGHLHYRQGQLSDAKIAYETVMSLPQGTNFFFSCLDPYLGVKFYHLEPENVALIYIRLGSIYLSSSSTFTDGNLPGIRDPSLGPMDHEQSASDIKLAKLSKTMYLRACEKSPTSQSWLGVGKACIALGEQDEAEDAFAVSNINTIN